MGVARMVLAASAALIACLPAVNAYGCNTEGSFFDGEPDFDFGNLHDGPYWDKDKLRDLTVEVLGDIAGTCRMVDGPWVFKTDTPFARCTDWKMQRQTQTCQLTDCPESCGDSGADGFSQCVTDCAYACPLEESLLQLNMNHLDFEIKHDGHGDDAREMTYDICNKALTDIYFGCGRGGDFEHEGFWFRIDPSSGNCIGV
ncbi:hypothetical protein LTR56_000236 [Elasticomyces elasticus]|nr:hypothetical protein LTR56_000236 [Elasticomyces elasticus]KAK3667222.1 hypothetical protein LTR22_002089 [Elasticomyces elasticus]KAK5768598.1 hypothetical protein LTS12_001021 [Elasticomyces elasticus]